MRKIRVVDSHTGGEPTRVVLGGQGPPLGEGTLAERALRWRAAHDPWRSAIVNEPRGSDVLVGALLVEPDDQDCYPGVIFFNNVGFLGMCGHGAIGVVATLAYLGRFVPGVHRLDTPVGVVQTQLHADGRVSVYNVPSFRHAADVAVDVPGVGVVRGDVAWGGNWFFLVRGRDERLRRADVEALTERAWRIRKALQAAGITGRDGTEIDHVELFGPAEGEADSRNFVLCPGKAYDRSPCGTGTSAKLACLHADGLLAPGVVYRQESITGSVFEGWYTLAPGDAPGVIRPGITGRAHVTAEATLLLDETDPLCWGLV